jgi:parallel beta-helix repeat protein
MSHSLRLTVITLLLAGSKLSAATQYVPPGGSIQQAVNAAAPGDPILVGNGVYPGGFVVTNGVALVSVNGPQFTVIDGGRVYLCDGASLTGFTITNGLATSGGGVFCDSTNAFLTNCVIVGNSAVPLSDSVGGGVIYGTLYNCVLSGNTATYGGGGAALSTLYNCTLTGNSVNAYGGGAYGCTLYNCVACFNTSQLFPYYADIDWTSIANDCCFSNPPFIDYPHGNLRLQANSPTGNTAYVMTATDLDGRPRIVGGTVDMGAYEFQPGISGAFIGWLPQYGLPTDGSADYTDPDHDGMNNWQEWVCGTCPTNAQSVLRLVSATPAGTNITVTWQSVAGVNYFMERSTNFASPFTHLASFIMGQAGTTSYADTNAVGAGPLFYRVGVLPSGTN